MTSKAPGKRHLSDSLRSALFATAMAAGLDEVASAGSIGGTVFGPNGSPAVGVDVTLRSTIGLESFTVTDAQLTASTLPETAAITPQARRNNGFTVTPSIEVG